MEHVEQLLFGLELGTADDSITVWFAWKCNVSKHEGYWFGLELRALRIQLCLVWNC